MKPLITKPGVYANLSCEDYFAEPCPAPALTNSGIRTLLDSCPAKFAYEHPAIGQPPENRGDTVARRLGDLVHRIALGKGTEYEISPHDRYQSSEAKAWKKAVEDAGKTPVKQAEFDQAKEMAARIAEAIGQETRGHPYETEVVIAWQRKVGDFAIWCRGMLDVWCPDLGLALDVKTCADASTKAIERQFANGYAGQDAWYRSGLDAISGEPGRMRFGFLFVENAAPWLYRFAESDEAFRYGGQQGCDRGAEIFARCLQSGEWPGFPPLTAVPPPWWLGDLTTTTDYQEAA